MSIVLQVQIRVVALVSFYCYLELLHLSCCPDNASFCPFKPTSTMFCLHFMIKFSTSIPPSLPPFCPFSLILLTSDISPNPGGKCPKFFKQAHVTPILTKSSLDKEVFKDYRPVSNLNFISKILERVVAVQLQNHLNEAGLMTGFQPVYNKGHSTESALLNIQNDLLLNMAKGSVKAIIKSTTDLYRIRPPSALKHQSF